MAEKKFFANESDRDKILRVLSSLSENENPVMVTMRLKKKIAVLKKISVF